MQQRGASISDAQLAQPMPTAASDAAMSTSMQPVAQQPQQAPFSTPATDAAHVETLAAQAPAMLQQQQQYMQPPVADETVAAAGNPTLRPPSSQVGKPG